MFNNIARLGANVSLVCRDEICSVYNVTDKTGEGQMTFYNVFPGIVLGYNDFHLEQCISNFRASSDMICINHCREGRIEWEFQKNQFIYLESGDLQLANQNSQVDHFSFPLHHYHGLTVGIFPKLISEELKSFLTDYSIDLPVLIERFESCHKPFTVRAGTGMAHIFSELYNVPKQIRPGYHKIKVLELLLFLSTLNISEQRSEHPYFHRSQVEKVKEIKEFLELSLCEHYTLEALSMRFDIGLTSMKQCFKAIYGMSIYSYIRAYRMNAAAVMLRRGKDSVSQIAAAMGYENASKFSAAFKKVIGLAPSEYRKSAV